MTFAAACGWSLLRSALVASCGLWLAVHVTPLLRGARGPRRMLAWGLLLTPLLTPGLIVGYGYRNYSLSLVHYPWWNETLYAAIAMFQALPVAVLLLYFAAPTPLSRQGIHCYRLARRDRRGARAAEWVERLLLELRGPRRAWLPAGAVLFLLAFQESEVASLMQARGWTEWMYTRQAGLVDVRAVWQCVGIVVAAQALLVAPVLAWLWDHRTSVRSAAASDGPVPSQGWWIGLIAGGVLNGAIPAGLVLRGAWDGWPVLRQQTSFWREMSQGLLLSATAAAIALWIARRLSGGRGHGGDAAPRRGARGVLMAVWGLALIPGLLGSMTLSLIVDAIFQQPWLVWAYDGPARLIVGLVLFLLPRTLLLVTCLPEGAATSALRTASLLRDSGAERARRSAGELMWQFGGRFRFWAYCISFFWAYLELTIATILAPPGMEPVVKRLYNLMHFGHIAGLAAMVTATLAVPLGIMLVFLVGRRLCGGWTAA